MANCLEKKEMLENLLLKKSLKHRSGENQFYVKKTIKTAKRKRRTLKEKRP